MADEVLRRRLVGAAVLLAAAFVLVSLLPGPGSAPPEDGVQVVTVDLDAPVSPPAPPGAGLVTPPTIEAPASPQATELPSSGPSAGEPAPEPAVDAGPAIETEATPAPAPVEDEPPPPVTVARTEPAASAPAPESEPPAPKPASKSEPPAPKPAARPDPVQPQPPVKPAPAAPSAPKAASTARTWSIQVGAFSDIAMARSAQDKLEAGGFESIIAPAETAKGTLYRVRAGRYAKKEDAGGALAKVQGLGFAEAAVKEN